MLQCSRWQPYSSWLMYLQQERRWRRVSTRTRRSRRGGNTHRRTSNWKFFRRSASTTDWILCGERMEMVFLRMHSGAWAGSTVNSGAVAVTEVGERLNGSAMLVR